MDLSAPRVKTSPGVSSEEVTGGSTALLVAGILFLGLQCAASLFPASWNWGMHHAAYLPMAVSALLLAGMALMLLPAVRRNVQFLLDRASDRAAHWPPLVRTGIGALFLLILGVLFWLLRERIFFLGDGHVLLRTIPTLLNAQDPSFFRNEPFPWYVLWRCWHICNAHGFAPTIEFPVQAVNIIAGIGAVVLVWFLVREQFSRLQDRLAAAGFILAAGNSQLFFGYVENYTIVYVAVMLFLLLALRYFHGKAHPALPSMAYALLFTSHFGMAALFPAVCWLWWHASQHRPFKDVLASIGAALGTAAAVLAICGYTPRLFFSIFAESEGHFVPLAGALSFKESYLYFSLPHLIDVVNLQLLLAPFALLLLLVAGLSAWRTGLKEPFLLMLVIASVFGFLLASSFNAELGVSRDWDSVSSYMLPLIVAAAFIWLHARSRRHDAAALLMMVAAITLFHTAASVAVNAREESSLKRSEVLLDPLLLGKHALRSGEETLGVEYRERGDAAHAIAHARRAVEIDPANSRLWASLGDLYDEFGEKENALHAYEECIARGTTFSDVYCHLGVLYAQRSRFDEALKLLQRSVQLDPNDPEPINAIGITLVLQGRPCGDALPYFRRAIAADPNFPDAYFNAGRCAFALKDYADMRSWFDAYVRLQPSSPSLPDIKTMLLEATRTGRR